MPNRILREGILTSARIAKLAWPEEVFYRRLMSVVDDFGRYYADNGLLRAACYPRQLNKVSDSDVEKWMRGCVAAALVRVYPAEDGESYLELLDFKQQVRAKASKFPEPRAVASTCAASATQAQANEHLDVFVSVSVSEDVSVSVSEDVYPPASPAKPVRSIKPKKTRIPDDFTVSDRVKAWAAEKGHSHLDRRLEHFASWARAKGAEYVDWDEALMNAIRDNWAKLPTNAPARHSGFAERDYSEGVTADGRF